MRLAPALLFAVLAAPAASASAGAAVIAVTGPAGLGATTTVNWDVRPPGIYSTPPATTVFGSRAVGFASSMGILKLADEGSGFLSNFMPGIPLLLHNTQQDTFIVNFDGPVRGVGAPIQDYFPSACTAQIRFRRRQHDARLDQRARRQCGAGERRHALPSAPQRRAGHKVRAVQHS